MPAPNIAIPVTTIGGYLGAGKTTLLNHVLSDDHGLRIAVLVNDFGAISIDEQLIVSRDGEIISLANGCACCSIAGDLAEALDRFARLEVRPDHILIEASGVANPARISEFARSPGLQMHSTIVLADAEAVEKQASDKFVGRLIRDQLARADLILLNKIDLLDQPRLDSLRTWIGGVAPGIRLIETVRGLIPPNVLFNAASTPGAPKLFGCEAVEADESTRTFESYCWTTPDRIDPDALRAAIAALPGTILRAKGIVFTAGETNEALVIQVAGGRWSIESMNHRPVSENTAIVFIAITNTLDRAALGTALDGCVVRTDLRS